MAIDYNKLTYRNVEGTIANGVNNQQVNKGTLTLVKSLMVTNFTTGRNMTFRLNANTNSARTVEGGKTFTISDEGTIENIYISNSSGGAIQYSVFMIGA